MAVKLESTDPAGSPHSRQSDSQQNLLEHSLQRGTRLLATLVQAARAARLEAEVAELKAALAEAREGSARRLERCLARLDAADDSELPQVVPADAWQAVPLSTVGTAAAAVDRAGPSTRELGGWLRAEGSRQVTSDAHAVEGWAPYLVHARRRLRELERTRLDARSACEALPTSELQPATRKDAIQRDVSPLGGSPASADEMPAAATAIESQIAGDESFDEPLDDAAEFGDAEFADTDFADTSRVAGRLAGVEDPEDSSEAIEDTVAQAVSAELELSALKTLSRELEPGPAVTRPMLSGFSLSLVGHIGLLAGLFLITLKQADQPASLGAQLVSAVAPQADVELAPQFDALEPIEMQLDDPLESSIDPAQLVPAEATALAAIEAAAVSPSPLMSASSSDSAGASRSPGAILAEAVGKPGGRARGGRSHGQGAPAMSSTGGKFFGAGAGGNFFCYVVDSSGSMRGAAWESAKAELVRSIGTLAENQRFYIVFFAKEVAAIPEPGGREPAAHGLAATKENIDHARRWIETVKLDRGGPPNDALELAIAREPDAIYLLTDGVTQVDVCAFLHKCNRTSDIISGEQVRVPIHAIAYHSLDGQQLLRRLAQENDGQFHYVPAPKY